MCRSIPTKEEAAINWQNCRYLDPGIVWVFLGAVAYIYIRCKHRSNDAKCASVEPYRRLSLYALLLGISFLIITGFQGR